jgi:hypothetical protein
MDDQDGELDGTQVTNLHTASATIARKAIDTT